MKVMVHCCLCDKEEEVEPRKATDYICDDCKEFYASLFSDAIHETAKQFRRTIIRCKDCKHQDPDRFDDGEGNYVCRKGHGWKPDNWFCADAERKDGDGE